MRRPLLIRSFALPVLAGLLAAAPAPAQEQSATRLRIHAVHDPMAGGIEAFRMLVPADWTVEGGIVWRPDLANQAAVMMRVSSPRDPERLEVYPNIPFIWDQGGIMGFPRGSLYMGQYVQPPLWDGASYVQQVILPQFRQGVAPRVVAREELPEVARQVARSIQEPGVEKRVVAERVRVAYEENGVPLEEDFYCVLVFARSPMLPNTVLWTTEKMFSFRARRGRLEARAPLLHAMVSSVRIDPVWFGQYMHVVQLWQQGQMQAIRNAGELSRYLAQTNEEITQMFRESWQQKQAADDHISRQFSEYIRGVETFADPVVGREVQLPSGYDEYWVSGNGEYLLSNRPGFDPNAGSTITWQRLRPSSP